MKAVSRIALLICAIWFCGLGCGGHSTSPTPAIPTTDTCSGVAITGVLHDSLTNQPITQAWAVLESGTQLSATQIFNFAPTLKVAVDTQGAFHLCAPTLANPSAIVIVALDSGGKAYPTFISAVAGATDFGTIPMGGCSGLCGFEGSQQTTVPAVITGVITSAPVATTGSVLAQYAVTALDGSKSTAGSAYLWSLAIPSLDTIQTNTFATTPGACEGAAPFCATYTYKLASQKPVQTFISGGHTGYLLGAGAPVYSIYAVTDGIGICVPPFGLTIHQQDGSSILTASPGAQITASSINFTQCK